MAMNGSFTIPLEKPYFRNHTTVQIAQRNYAYL
jgi:hypothetical protein